MIRSNVWFVMARVFYSTSAHGPGVALFAAFAHRRFVGYIPRDSAHSPVPEIGSVSVRQKSDDVLICPDMICNARRHGWRRRIWFAQTFVWPTKVIEQKMHSNHVHVPL